MCTSTAEYLPSILMAEVQSIGIGKREIIRCDEKEGIISNITTIHKI